MGFGSLDTRTKDERRMPFPIYRVGPDALYCRNDKALKRLPTDVRFAVYWYENEGYEGSGLIAGLSNDGMILFTDLGHCSCGDGMKDRIFDKVPLAEFLAFDKFCNIVRGRKRETTECDSKYWRLVVKRIRNLVKKI